MKNDNAKLITDICECYTFSSAHDMVFRFYTYVDCCYDEKSKATGTKNLYSDELIECMKILISDDKDVKELTDRLIALRDKVCKRTEEVTTVTDTMRLYEHILNRLPVNNAQTSTVNNDVAARDCLSAIFKYNDNNIINENIKLAVSQLPVRMTRARFFDIVNDAFTKYTGGPVSALDRFVYMLEGAAGIKEYGKIDSKDIKAVLTLVKKLKETDFKDIDLKEGGKLAASLEKQGAAISAYIDGLTDTAMIINSMLCYLLSSQNIEKNPLKPDTQLYRVLCEALNGYESPAEWKEAGTDVIDTFSDDFLAELERKQEKLAVYEGRLDGIDSEADGNDDILEKLNMCRKLMSGSYFAPLTDTEADDDHPTDADEAQKKFELFRDKLEVVLKNDIKNMQRARMAAILAELPVFFNSRTEVMNYVRDSLDSCKDNFEKAMSVNLTLRIIAD